MSVPKNACSVVEEKGTEIQSGFAKLISSLKIYVKQKGFYMQFIPYRVEIRSAID